MTAVGRIRAGAIVRAAGEIQPATRDLAEIELRATLLATVAEHVRRFGAEATAATLEGHAARLREMRRAPRTTDNPPAAPAWHHQTKETGQ